MVNLVNLTSNTTVTPTTPASASTAVGNAVQDTALRLDQILLGKSLQAQVMSIAKDGLALLTVTAGEQKGGQLKMPLPPGYKAGDQVVLTLVSNDGNKPSFSVTPFGATQSNLVLSSTGQFLTELLQQHVETKHIAGTNPLIATADPDPQHLAVQLQNAIENSGVFYESHLKQWNDGNRSVDQIRQEPQNLNPNQEAANAIIPLQLGVIENKNLIWFGTIWPDQQMEWDVSKYPKQGQPDTGEEDNPGKSVWLSTLKLELPNLGSLTARIRLQGNQTRLDINTDNPEVRETLKAHSEHLANSLASAGISLETLATHPLSNE